MNYFRRTQVINHYFFIFFYTHMASGAPLGPWARRHVFVVFYDDPVLYPVPVQKFFSPLCGENVFSGEGAFYLV